MSPFRASSKKRTKIDTWALGGMGLLVPIFLLDANLPLGIALGVAYALPIFIVAKSEQKRLFWLTVTLACSLTLLVYLHQETFASPNFKALTNRVLSILNIILISYFIHHIRWFRTTVSTIQEQIENSSVIRKAINSLSEGLSICNLNGELVFSNQKAKEVLGIDSDKETPDQWHDTFGTFLPDQKTPFPEQDYPLVKALQGEKVRDQVIFIRNHFRPKGMSISCNADPIHEEGRIIGAIVLFNDVTETLKLRDQLYQSQKMEAIGRLSAGIAHDFNNKLAAMLLYASTIKSKLEHSEDVEEELSLLSKCILNSRDFTQQILAFGRKQMLTPKVFSMSEIIERNLSLYQRLAGENIRLKYKFEPKNDHVFMDEGQMEQVLINLIVNAKEAIKQHGDILIETTYEAPKNPENQFKDTQKILCLKISDTGIGIPIENLDSIFEIYFSTKQNSSGLGLSTVYGILKQSGGTIEVTSTPGKGTTFQIYLPLTDKQIQTNESTSHKLEVKTNLNFLIIEDVEDIRNQLSELLALMGFQQVFAVSSGEEALELIKNTHFDVLITDIMLPGISGRDVNKKLLELDPNLKTLFISGYSENILSENGIVNKDIHFLSKPFSMTEFKKKLGQVMSTVKT